MLVECDPSIKAIINEINKAKDHKIVIQDIDDEHVLVNKDKHEELKLLLKEVSLPTRKHRAHELTQVPTEIERHGERSR